MEIITRKEAQAQGLKRYFTGKPCKYGHVSKRTVSNGKCGECEREYKQTNKEKIAERVKEYYQNNKEKILERRKEIYQNKKSNNY